ncbi:MAG TPA: hypothetical protein VLZ84_11750 [Asticcacaulis sp.]|nr:hypothetical protein [Asticcacaulis sp.]
MFDKRARDILFNAYWQPAKGWARKPVEPEDFAYAKKRSYMFDPVRLSHDQVVDKLIEVRRIADKAAITEAFLASLSTRRLEWRSALGSYGFARHFPAHRIKSSPHNVFPTGAMMCHCCGLFDISRGEDLDLNVLNFERHKWGGVRRTNPVYAWFDLNTARLQTTPTATEADREILRNIVVIANSLTAKATVSHLVKMLNGVFRSSEAERRIIIEILATCGILNPKGRPGFFSEFAATTDREYPHHSKNDWNYPAIWWTGADGLDETALEYWFPEL